MLALFSKVAETQPQPQPQRGRRVAASTSRPKFFSALASALLLAASACGGGSANEADATSDASEAAGTTTEAETEETGTTEPLEVSLEIRANPNNVIGPFGDVTAEGASEVRVRVFEGDQELFVRDADMPGTNHSAFLWGLHENGSFRAVAEARNAADEWFESASVEFSTGALPAGLPQADIVVHDPARAHKGLVLFGTTDAEGQMVYVGYDAEGTIRWYYPVNGDGTKSGGDVKVLEDGRLFLFRNGGMRIIEPWGETVFDVDIGYHHDLTPMPSGGYLVLVRREETHDIDKYGGPAVIDADGIIELSSTGDIVKEWWASDHLDVQRWPSDIGTNMEPYDWTHANAVYWIPEQERILMSLRHQHWVIAIDWPTGEVDWALGPGGDFAFDGPAEDWFYNQHSPELQADGAILVYDNGNERPGTGEKYSRGVIFEVDETNMTATMQWDHALTPFTRVQGDANRMSNGHVLINAGGIINSPYIARIIEATDDAASEAVWELALPNGENVYRATPVDGF